MKIAKMSHFFEAKTLFRRIWTTNKAYLMLRQFCKRCFYVSINILLGGEHFHNDVDTGPPLNRCPKKLRFNTSLRIVNEPNATLPSPAIPAEYSCTITNPQTLRTSAKTRIFLWTCVAFTITKVCFCKASFTYGGRFWFESWTRSFVVAPRRRSGENEHTCQREPHCRKYGFCT